MQEYLYHNQNKCEKQKARNGIPSTKTLRDSLNVRGLVVTEALPGMCRTHPYITRQCVSREATPGRPADLRPIPHMISSNINSTPYFLQTDFIALK